MNHSFDCMFKTYYLHYVLAIDDYFFIPKSESRFTIARNLMPNIIVFSVIFLQYSGRFEVK